MPDRHAIPAASGKLLEAGRFRHGDQLVIAVAGEIDVSSVGVLHRALRQEMPSVTVLDLSEVTFLGAAGLGAIAGAAERAKSERKRLGLVVKSHVVSRALRIVGMDTFIPIFSSCSSAVHELSRAQRPPGTRAQNRQDSVDRQSSSSIDAAMKRFLAAYAMEDPWQSKGR
ncbi:STAS domain-containing protein [Amycolatopsis coloradensis]|uniref:STAS domain-containing protein n=1 Tax=Amycolatopsis coloradensis TaxID=76021 RepID=A0ACD5BPS9_9PSEU